MKKGRVRVSEEEKDSIRAFVLDAREKSTKKPNWETFAALHSKKFGVQRSGLSLEQAWYRILAADKQQPVGPLTFRQKRVQPPVSPPPQPRPSVQPRPAQPTAEVPHLSIEEVWQVLEAARANTGAELERVEEEIKHLNERAQRLREDFKSLETALKARVDQ